jgi:transposase-like protein
MTTEHEHLRLQHWRLKIIQEATSKPRNSAPVCRKYHISRQTFYKWHDRYLQVARSLSTSGTIVIYKWHDRYLQVARSLSTSGTIVISPRASRAYETSRRDHTIVPVPPTLTSFHPDIVEKILY